MKTIKIILPVFLSVVIAASLCLTCFAYIDRQNSWLTLSGTIMDETNVLIPLGDYSCSFTLNTSTGNMAYALNIDPPQMNPANYARSKLVYKLKVLNFDYSTLHDYYETFYVPFDDNPIDYDDYYYSFITNPNNANSFTTLKSYTGSNSTSTTSISENVNMSINHFYYFDIDLSSSFKTQYYGDENFDIVCIPIGSYSSFHYYY